jgi:hypothetical protein
MPIPGETMDSIREAVAEITTSENRLDLTRRLFWTPTVTVSNTLIMFLGEFKRELDEKNQNQLLIDFRTAQSQRYVLGLTDSVIWGATCAMGEFTVYSSMWNDAHSVSSPSRYPYDPY